jgi:Zn-dependent protease with chaperone function
LIPLHRRHAWPPLAQDGIMGDPSFYPASPAGVPGDLTAVGGHYRFQVILVLAYLALFVLAYLALLAGAGYLLYLSLRSALRGHEDMLLWWAAVLGSGLLLWFLAQPLFRRTRPDRSLLVEVRATDQPELFAFIRRLCAEIRAPQPRKVFLAPEVNAAVVSATSIVNLVVPARQDLVIGLGLVNVLNLVEFKAVLAHEFGHFSQKGVRLGPYVYTSARLITDIVRGSDRADYLLRRLTPVAEAIFRVATIDFRLAVLVLPLIALLYLLIGVVKGFSAVFGGLRRLIQLAMLSLMRQMEFNADLVAVRVAGSDAPIDVLVRLPLADSALRQVAQDLTVAAEAGLHTRDLFYHQGPAAVFLRQLSNNPRLGEPPPRPPEGGPRADIFRPDDTAAPPMWATHPSRHEREQNAKRHYLPSPVDDRPSWVLFHDAAGLRERVTRRFYQHLLERADLPAPAEPETVQAFINDEHAETTYDPRYQGAYDDRYLEPGKPDELTTLARSRPWEADRLARAPTELYLAAFAQAIADYRDRRRELEALEQLIERPEFEFRGQKYRKGDARQLHVHVSREVGESRRRLATLDRDVFLAHYQMADRLGPQTAQALVDRYRFHLALQPLLAQLTEQRDWLHSVLYFLSQRKEISEGEYGGITSSVRGIGRTLAEKVAAADSITVPELKNLKPGQPLGRLLLGDRSLADFQVDEKALKPGRLFASLMELAGRVGKVRDRAHRLHFKSLAGLLTFQEQVHARWLAAAPTENGQETHPAATPSEQPLGS